MISFAPNKTCVLDIKNDERLDGFVKTLLCSGYTISQSESTKDDYVKIFISYDTKKILENADEEIC